MNNTHLVESKPTDYLKGVSSPIPFKAVTSGDWTSHLQFFERQKIQFETDGCEFFTAQESFDAQMDNLIGQGIPSNILTELVNMGYMDTGNDSNAHFHSSPRFLQVMSGVEQNGASMPQVWDVMRKYGCLPYTDLPFDATVNSTEYFAPVSATLQAKATQFLALMGGKQAIQYHWLWQNAPKNIMVLTKALQQAPVCFGVAVTDGWNQAIPSDPPANQVPQHAVMCYAVSSGGCRIYDHYDPPEKNLDAGYNVPYALQGILTPAWTVAQEVTQIVKQTEQILPQVTVTQQNVLLTALQNLLTTVLKWLQN